MTENLIEYRHMKHVLQVIAFAGTLCAAISLFGEAKNPSSAAAEVRTFRLQYASAAEVSGQINQLMSREVGPGGALLPVAVANAEANTVTVMAPADKRGGQRNDENFSVHLIDSFHV